MTGSGVAGEELMHQPVAFEVDQPGFETPEHVQHANAGEQDRASLSFGQRAGGLALELGGLALSVTGTIVSVAAGAVAALDPTRVAAYPILVLGLAGLAAGVRLIGRGHKILTGEQ